MHTALQQVPGFRRIVHVFQLTPSALVEVSPDQYDEFIKHAPDSPMVAYCSVNGPLRLAGFAETLHPTTPSRQISTSSLHQAHGVNTTNSLPGFGIRIAVLDSGLAPHPYLPSISFTSCAYGNMGWVPSLARVSCIRQRIDDLAVLEQQQPIFDPQCPPQAEDAYLGACQNKLAKLDEEVWYEVTGNNRAIQKKLQLSAPEHVPLKRGLFGGCRKISPQSVSLLGARSSLDLEDRIGHGTQLAGILSAVPPLAFLEANVMPPDVYHYLSNQTVELSGLAPYAELVIIKCFDALMKGDLFTLAKGIEYAVDGECDIILCALTLSVADIQAFGGLGAIRHLEDTIKAARSKDVCVIAAAGNEGFGSGCLTVPAAFNSVIAIGGASVGVGGGNVRMSPICNLPGQNEKIDFFAAADIADLGVVTTTMDFGFGCVRGSSISAAVAAGLFARAMSFAYLSQLDPDLCVQLNLKSGVPTKRRKMGQTPQRRPSWSTFLAAAESRSVPIWGPRNLQGKLLRDFVL
ncbi:MAG: in-like serine protease [Phycisphaerales bacterium]|nr:in-like serine protease [Phycisphaerales bacterium]